MFDLNKLAAIRAKLLHEGNSASAFKVAVFATQEFPESSAAWYELAAACLEIGDLSRAREAIHRCLALAPRNTRALALRGRIAAVRIAGSAQGHGESCGCQSGAPCR